MDFPEKPQHVNLVQECVTAIRAYVTQHQFHSGEKLPSIQEWGKILDVSVMVVREAFRTLEALGYVDIQHGRGIFLHGDEEMDLRNFISFRQSLEDLTGPELIEVRAMLDLVMIETCIARADQKELDEMEKIWADLRDDPDRFSQCHRRFHQIMLEATGNRLLMAIAQPLMNTFWTLGPTGKIDWPETDEYANHQDIIEAIRNRDFSNTRQLVDRHLGGLCSKYQVFPYAPEQKQ